MKPRSLPMEIPSYARPYLGMVIFTSAFAFALPYAGLRPIQFIDPPAMVIMCLTTYLPAAFLWWQAKVPPAKVLLVLSVPAGIMCCVAGMHGILHLGVRESYSLGANSAVMLLTVLYSTVIAFFGYMLDQKDKDNFGTLPLKNIILPILFTVGTLYLIAVGTAEANLTAGTAFFSEEIFIFFIAIFAALTL